MRAAFGRILQILGWGCVGWFGFVGGGFLVIYLMGFVGTGGREAGGGVVFFLAVTVVGVVIGLLTVKLGTSLTRPRAGQVRSSSA